MNIRPLHNGIIVQFKEEIDKKRNSSFKEVSEAGIITFADRDASAKQGRWATVVSVGGSVLDSDIQPGAEICIEPLKWTSAVTLEGQDYWKTDEDQVLAVQPKG